MTSAQHRPLPPPPHYCSAHNRSRHRAPLCRRCNCQLDGGTRHALTHEYLMMQGKKERKAFAAEQPAPAQAPPPPP